MRTNSFLPWGRGFVGSDLAAHGLLAISDTPSPRNQMQFATVTIRILKFLMKFLSILLVIVLPSGCSWKPMAAPDPALTFEPAIIVVPGYYGTRLVQETDGSLIFISLNQALFGDQTLTLPAPGLGLKERSTYNLKAFSKNST